MATFKDNSYEPKPYRQLYQQSVDHVNNTIDRHISETLEARTVKLKTLTEKLKNITPRTAEIDTLIEEALKDIENHPQQPHYLAGAWFQSTLFTTPTYNAGGVVEIVPITNKLSRLLETNLEEEFTSLETKLDTIETKAAEEKKRLEEEARKAAEAAAAAARASSGGYVSNGETREQRVERLMNKVGVNIAYVIRDCSIPNSIACYTPGTNQIVLVPRLFERSDCTVARAITHEYRHHQQWIQGLMQIENGVLINRDWLEADARNHEYC